MKMKFLLATIIVAALGGGIYYYITNSKPVNPPIPKFDTKLVGSWKIDTAYNSKDSTKLSMLVAYLFKDSSIVEFAKDSTLKTITPKATDVQKYYVLNDSLFVENDTSFILNTFKFFNDSSFALTSPDSTIVVYKKMK